MNSFKVIKAGFFSTLQNNGKLLTNKVILGGVMDEYSYFWGNYLLGNKSNSLSLEITFGGLELQALTSLDIVVTGANGLRINSILCKNYLIIAVKKGDIISFDYPSYGVRSYLNIAGGFIGAIGKIKINQTLKINKSNNNYYFMPKKFIPNYASKLNLKIYINNYDNFFNQEDINYFLNKKWEITMQNNRMVYALKNGDISPNKLKFYSQANSFGSVQITPNGEPIIMHRDAPTIGGYPKIGTIFSLDMSNIAQRTAKQKISFAEISINDMQNARIKFDTFFKNKSSNKF